jgi:hypothetical protein
LGTFWLKIEQFWPFEEISIFSNGGHLGYRTALTDTILDPPRFGLIWISAFREEDLNVIFYQNMPNLHNRYISTESKISQKNPENMLNYSLPCSSISSPLFSIFSLVAILVGSRDHRTQFWKGAIQGPFHQSLVAIGLVVSEEKIKM